MKVGLELGTPNLGVLNLLVDPERIKMSKRGVNWTKITKITNNN